jgi:putative ABC transport system substrate-binding protein
MGLDTEVMTISSTNDVSQVGATLASQVDAIWVPTDNTVASAMTTLVSAADSNGIPIFPAVDTMVEEGGLATVGLDQYELGRLTGEMVAAILNGESDPATTPIRYLDEGEIIINQEKAKQLGITIPTQLLEQAKQAE